MDKPLVTCVILNYNNTRFIHEAIDSILEQRYSKIELAIFDDASTEFPKEELINYIEKNKGDNIKNVIVSVAEENEGTVRNYNNAIQGTSGKYIVGMGTDDMLYDDTVLQKVVSYFEKDEYDIVTTRRQAFSEDNPCLNIVPSIRLVNKWNAADSKQQYKYIAMGFPIAGAGTFYARSYFDKYGLFDEEYRLQEDGPNFLRGTRLGAKFGFVDIIGIKYRMGYGVSSNSRLNPMLVNDITHMFEKEIIPYKNDFSFGEKRKLQYQIERIKEEKLMSIWKKLWFVIKYPDVIIYRKRMQ